MRGWIYERLNKGMLYLNVTLEKVMRDLETVTKGTVCNKSTEILAYTDDCSKSREIRCTEVNNEEINESSTGNGADEIRKTKYMEVTK